MKIRTLPRAKGKTIRALSVAEYLGVPIVCNSVYRKDQLLTLIKEFDYDIPSVKCIDDIAKEKRIGGCVIDDLDACLNQSNLCYKQ